MGFWKMKDALSDVRSILGLGESTSVALTSPSHLGDTEVMKAVKEMPLDDVVGAFAVIAGNAVADEVQRLGYSPPTYAKLDGLPKSVRTLLIEFLSSKEGSKLFEDSLVAQVAARG